MGFLTGKRALITGLVSNRSIASGIAEAMHREGCEMVFSYFGDKMKDRVQKLAAGWGSEHVLPCDVQSDKDITALMKSVEEIWPDGFDILVHSIAFAPGDQLDGDYLDCVTREGFQISHDVSAYSFAALAKGARPLMQKRPGASMVTMTYLGAEKACPNYNVMGVAKASLEANMRYMALSLGKDGIRANAISAGPIKTLAASGIKGFKDMLKYSEKVNPLGKTVSTEEVGNTAAFLCSDLASGITGEVVHVDAGYHMVTMAGLDDA